MAKCPYCNKPVTLSEKTASSPESRPVRKEVLGAVKIVNYEQPRLSPQFRHL